MSDFDQVSDEIRKNREQVEQMISSMKQNWEHLVGKKQGSQGPMVTSATDHPAAVLMEFFAIGFYTGKIIKLFQSRKGPFEKGIFGGSA